MQDEKLIGLLRSDPERGMEQLVKQYCGLVYAVIRGKLLPDIFSEADVDHCVGDTFSEFYCGLDRYSPQRGSIRSWLCVMAKNNALDRLRSHCREAGNVSLDTEGMVELPDDFSLEVDFENPLGGTIREAVAYIFYAHCVRHTPEQSARVHWPVRHTRLHA